jgi:hypothetical protein
MNMNGCIWSSSLAVAALLALQSTASHAQSGIGKATRVKPDAQANTRTLAAGSDAYSNETIRTGNSGVADLRFNDNSNLSVGPTSVVRLDKFVYDPNKGAGSIAIEASRGAFRFVTGSKTKASIGSRLPTAPSVCAVELRNYWTRHHKAPAGLLASAVHPRRF